MYPSEIAALVGKEFTAATTVNAYQSTSTGSQVYYRFNIGDNLGLLFGTATIGGVLWLKFRDNNDINGEAFYIPFDNDNVIWNAGTVNASKMNWAILLVPALLLLMLKKRKRNG